MRQMLRFLLCLAATPESVHARPGRILSDMTRDEWLDQFSDELIKLRPHVSHKLARTLALHAYVAAAHPRTAAREYHARQQPAAAPVAAKRVKRG
jgi:hypothetical protein